KSQLHFSTFTANKFASIGLAPFCDKRYCVYDFNRLYVAAPLTSLPVDLSQAVEGTREKPLCRQVAILWASFKHVADITQVTSNAVCALQRLSS
ncbi:hypothetical protein LSAT2_009529, partial [Lamellibrachia satsuma]